MTISKKLAASLAQSFHELCDICEMIHEMQHPFFDLAQRHPEDKESFMKLHELCDFIEPAQDQFTETEGLLRELISPDTNPKCAWCRECTGTKKLSGRWLCDDCYAHFT